VRQAPVAGGYSQPAEEQEAKPKRDYQGELEGIAQRLETLANKQVVLKAPVEERWLRDIRLYHGKYDAALLASMKAGGQSTAFVKLARAKTVALEARIFDLMWPTDDRNWDAFRQRRSQAQRRAEGSHHPRHECRTAGDRRRSRQRPQRTADRRRGQ
jgi:hypothetical protein